MGLKNSYGYEIHLSQNGKILKNYHGTFSLHFLGLKNSKQIVALEMNKMFIDHKEPDLMLTQLAEKIAQSFYPILFSLNPDGSINQIENLPEIRKQYREEKDNWLNYYKGELVQKLLKNVEKELNNPMSFQEKLLRNPIIEFLFFPIYHTYTASLQREFQFHSISMQSSFIGLNYLREDLSRGNKIQLEMKGNFPNDGIDLNKRINLKHDAELPFQCKIKLNAVNHSLFSLVGKIHTKSEETYSIGIYQIDSSTEARNEQNLSKNKPNTNQQKETEMKKVKKETWWDLFKNYKPKA